MSRPVDDDAEGAPAGLQEVRDAYRGLPAPEPSAALDARVRAAVAAELAGPAGGARVIPFPRWRRAALPLATAATVVMGVALWQWRATHEEASAPGGAQESIVASVRVAQPPAAAPAAPAAPAALVASADKAEAESRERVAGAPPPARQLSSPSLAQESARRAEPSQRAKRAEVASDRAAPAAAQPPVALGNVAPAGAPMVTAPTATVPKATVPMATIRTEALRMQSAASGGAAQQADAAPQADAATFAEAHQLIAAHRVDEARALLARWRTTHEGVEVPEDLRPLLPEASRPAEAPPRPKAQR